MTFSLAGRCSQTGAVGAVISSSSIAVTSRCLWGSPDGIALTQNVTDPVLGVIGSGLLGQHHGAAAVLAAMETARPFSEWRQLAVLDAHGASAWFTGSRALGTSAAAQGTDCVALGNMLATADVPASMVRAFTDATGQPLAARLLTALEAGLKAGGEAGPVHSAGLRVYLHEPWPIVDLRIDWSDTPISDLRANWDLYEPQMRDYVLRARNPGQAPSYGVPGDL